MGNGGERERLRPVIILGAPRSGTNILRDVVTRIPGYATWPCDEINYIWRHGNRSYPTDALTPDHARPRVRAYIRDRFRDVGSDPDLRGVVEKTCANCLRVGFVDAVFPGARYLFLVRDGRDVVSSAMTRWRAPIEFLYLARKARFVPLADLPYYAVKFVWNRLKKLFGSGGHLSTWGPRIEGMQQILKREGLAATCAHQWVRCVDTTERDLESISSRRVLHLHYEDFVTDPGPEIRRIAEFLEEDISEALAEEITRGIRDTSVGSWRHRLSEAEKSDIVPIVQPLLQRYGYLDADDERAKESSRDNR